MSLATRSPGGGADGRPRRAICDVITVCDSARQDCPVFPGEGQRLP
jgi:hypothetical protein